jgi:cobaltochelatase CobS
MTEELEQLIKKMKEAAPKKELEGGGIDEQKVSQIINEKIFDLVNNPKTALQIMATILKDPKNPNYPKWEELKKNLKVSEDEDMTITPEETKIVDDLLSGNNVYLQGKAGTGKTYLAEKIANNLKYVGLIGENQEPFYTINCSQWTSPIDIIGGFTVDGFRQGRAIEAWINGGVLILDELPKLDPNTAGLLNDILAKTAKKSARVRDGEGKSHKKNPKFYVIATGNTDLITVGGAYSGNNRQDYSLFDRFAGSFHTIGYNEEKEKTLNTNAVFEISVALREFLDLDPNSLESITLRTMLSFDRIYQLEMLRKIGSPIAPEPFGGLKGKTFKDSVLSFINRLQESRKERLITDCKVPQRFSLLGGKSLMVAIDAATDEANCVEQFIKDYERLKGIDPNTGKAII